MIMDYIALHNTENGFCIDEFSLFASVISVDSHTITFLRFSKFGELKWPNPVTLSLDDFFSFYIPLWMVVLLYARCFILS